MQIAEFKAKVIRVLKYVRKVDVPTRAASVSYFAMLASIPLLAIILTLCAQLLPDLNSTHAVGLGHLTTSQLDASLARLLPVQANEIIRKEITRIQTEPPIGLLSIGLLLSLWTSSNAYIASVTAMNDIYGVTERRPAWQVRLTGLFMPLVFALILVTALTCIVAAPMIIGFFKLDYFAGSLMTLAQWAVLFAIVLLSFEASYRFGPMDGIGSPRLSPGSITGATIFLATSLLFQVYVRQFGSYDKVYGSLGGAIIFLVWIWMSNACLLLGCAVNRALEDEEAVRKRNIREFIMR